MSILNFFAEHPDQSFSLTQIAKALRLNQATCHTLLLALAEGDYLYRNPDKSFVLGSAVLALGQAAIKHFSPLDVARQEMRLIADELDLVVAALFLEGTEIVVRERAASVSNLGWVPAPGQRYLQHSFNSAFIIFSSPARFERWIGEVGRDMSDEDMVEVLNNNQFFQKNGYIFTTARAGGAVDIKQEGLDGLVKQLSDYGGDLDMDKNYNVLFLTAPVRNVQGDAVFVLNIYGFSRMYSGHEVAMIGARLREMCDRVTMFITGKARFPRAGLSVPPLLHDRGIK